VITDALVAPLLAVVSWVVGKLPSGHALALPSLDELWQTVAQVDSLVPVYGPLQVMLGVLALGAVFVVVRLVLTVWNLIWP
jgi:hypothetical protein